MALAPDLLPRLRHFLHTLFFPVALRTPATFTVDFLQPTYIHVRRK